MRAAVLRHSAIVLDEVPDPEPACGEVLVKTLACGICGSDLHALRHADAMVEAARDSGVPSFMDPSRDIVMGHEFCAEIVGFGPDTSRRLPAGTMVVSMPMLFREQRFEAIGYSNAVPGGYGEAMLLSEAMLLDAPRGARIVVAGVCMEVDRFRPMIAINKELSLQFVLGYTPHEFSSALRSIAEGEIDVGPMITGRVPLDGVEGAFADLASPDIHAKIIVDPR